MQFETILFERRAQVAHVTLNRPERLNALNRQLATEMSAAAGVIAADPDIRSVLLTGAGRAFCAGADLLGGDLFADGSESLGKGIGAVMRDSFNPMVHAWFHLPKPVVVAVNGVAAGAGASIALLGDIVLAARSASFLQLFAPKLGLMPDLGGSFHLPRLVGAARAKGLALLGRPLSAEDAENWGLIWSCVEDAGLMSEAERIALELASGPSEAYRRIKVVFNEGTSRGLTEVLETELQHQAALGDTEDFKEGVAAFRAKRAPRFIGR